MESAQAQRKRSCMKFSDHLRGHFARATLLASLAAASFARASTDEGKREQQTQTPIRHLVVISPFAKRNFVDHTVTDQSSVLRFIEDNWGTGRIGNFSFDTKAGSLLNLFSFGGAEGEAKRLFLDPATGLPADDR